MRATAQPYVAGSFRPGHDLRLIVEPWNGSEVAWAASATPGDVETSLAASLAAPSLPPGARAELLDEIAAHLQAHNDELADNLVAEAGKPLRAARREALRAAEIFRFAAAEVRHGTATADDYGVSPRQAGSWGLVRRVPYGTVLAITPANSPLSLVAHKVAPALAVGAPIIVKPHEMTPLSALAIARACHAADAPPGTISVLTGGTEVGQALLDDDRIAMLSFTGSAVGWRLQALRPERPATLELGGMAPVIVDRTADLTDIGAAIASGATGHAGQSCISAQRLLIHESLYHEVLEQVTDAMNGLVVGNPHREATDVGPLLTLTHAEKVASWVEEAVEAGAELWCGGDRKGNLVHPTLLTDVPAASPLVCSEVFSPILVAEPVPSLTEACARVNDSAFGIHVGVFATDVNRALRAWDRLRYRGVIVNDTSDWRSDVMAYGGLRTSGLGSEGPRAAMTSMTYERTLVFSRSGDDLQS